MFAQRQENRGCRTIVSYRWPPDERAKSTKPQKCSAVFVKKAKSKPQAKSAEHGVALLQALPAEPTAGEEDAVQVAVRMPSGTRLTRRYKLRHVLCTLWTLCLQPLYLS